LVNNFPFKPRNYQLEARYNVNSAINNNEHPLLVMPTGTGKSKTSAMIISDQIKLGKIVFIICPQIEIFSQLLTDYAFLNPGYINDEGLKGQNRNLYVCMAISLVNILPLIPESLYPSVILTDECHHSKADTWQAIYDYFPKANRIGMTATPVRTDGKPLGDLYTEIIEPITIKEAVEQEFLTESIVITPEEFLQDIPFGDEINEKKQAELLGTPQIIGQVIETYERVLNGIPTLFACCSYSHAREMRDSFRLSGWVADHIHSGLSKDDRKSMLKRMGDNETNALFTVGIGIEGFDCSNIGALAYLRRTESTTIFVQFNGRPMRLGDNKPYCYILDFVGNCVIHGMPDRVRTWDLVEGEIIDNEDEKISFQKCPDCSVYNSIDKIECHWCGCDLTAEGKKEGTCRRCQNWKEGECSEHTDMIKACPIWLITPGCPSFHGKGRNLPQIVDGRLVAVKTNGQIHELKKRTEDKKQEIRENIEMEEKKNAECETIDSFEKRKIIRKGLFMDHNQREFFKESLGAL
jgi:superfamily II DNA or RNA helicase